MSYSCHSLFLWLLCGWDCLSSFFVLFFSYLDAISAVSFTTFSQSCLIKWSSLKSYSSYMWVSIQSFYCIFYNGCPCIICSHYTTYSLKRKHFFIATIMKLLDYFLYQHVFACCSYGSYGWCCAEYIRYNWGNHIVRVWASIIIYNAFRFVQCVMASL